MKQTEKILTLSSSAMIGALLLTGCGSGNNEPAAEAPAETTAVAPENESTAEITDDPSDGQAATPTEGDSASAAADDTDGGETASLAAVETALSNYEGGDVLSLDYDRQDNVYEADVVQNDTKHDVTVDGAGQNITNERADGTADQDDVDELGRASISIDEAIKRVFEETSSQEGAVLLDDASLDEDNGTLNWEVEVDIADRDTTYYVDASEGSVRSDN